MIELNRVGRIKEGDDCGQFIRVEFDPDDTGGYYILQSTSQNFDTPETYDAWIKSKSDLEAFFAESCWEIEWL